MSTLEEQDKVLATAAHMLDGRRCEDPRAQAAAGRVVVPQKTLVNKIFVGRLNEKITDEVLRDFFDKEAKQIIDTASVTDVFIPRPFRGFAFVTFTHAEIADRMCKANNFVIDGMSVIVTLAVPREDPHTAAANMYNDLMSFPYNYPKAPGFAASPGGHVPYPPRSATSRLPSAGIRRLGAATGRSPRNASFKSARNRHQAAKDIQPGTAAVYPPLPQQGPSGVVPPQLAYMYQRDGQAASNQIASGLDALNLNKKNPELMSAAWNAFFSTLSSGGASPQPHKQW
ncbi:unnamed protein product [Nippostrongylus brasiliensis]|uniref:TAR DNA-binding protein 43 (inferred by orthology to a human protein) n=1 Tax=Nippostrongylus brasiliensis TaxID=27835 RepID=A0A0N4XE89_NIPBR|nr:unnamed protein product [Nippostrongylus brasiliensis]